MLRRQLTLLALLATLLIAGCGDDDTTSETPATSSTATETAAAEPAETPEESTGTASSGDISDDLTKKPEIAKPSGDPPTELKIDDVVEGKGPAAKAGDTVSVQYVGSSFSTGEQFDASWDRGEPFEFPLGGGSVIQGWDQGVVGMKKGGRRVLTIPPALGYGEAGSPPAIAPNETLIFVIDLEEIT